MIILID